MTKLSDTQRVILSAAAQHEMGFASPPTTLPTAARNAVFRSLIKNKLLTEINAPRDHVGLGWRHDGERSWIVARITDDGLRAIGTDPNEGDAVADTAPPAAPAPDAPAEAEAVHAPPTAPEVAFREEAVAMQATTPRTSLRTTASALIDAWDACPAVDARDNPISRAIDTKPHGL